MSRTEKHNIRPRQPPCARRATIVIAVVVERIENRVAVHDAELAARAIKAGAQDYCTKSQGSTALLDSVCKAIQAGRLVRESILAPAELDHTHETPLRILELTPREREVLELLASGNGNQQVAALLGISVKTVVTHRASLMRKTQSDSLATLTGHWYAYKSCG